MDSSTLPDIEPSYQPITAPTPPLNQCSLTNTGSQLGALGVFLLLFIISCLCLEQWHRKRCEQQASVHQQQVEILERIWSMGSR